MKFTEWFDPNNIEHIQAYKHLQNTGAWPNGFKLNDIFPENNWQILLAFKLANAWVDYKLNERGNANE